MPLLLSCLRTSVEVASPTTVTNPAGDRGVSLGPVRAPQPLTVATAKTAKDSFKTICTPEFSKRPTDSIARRRVTRQQLTWATKSFYIRTVLGQSCGVRRRRPSGRIVVVRRECSDIIDPCQSQRQEIAIQVAAECHRVCILKAFIANENGATSVFDTRAMNSGSSASDR